MYQIFSFESFASRFNDLLDKSFYTWIIWRALQRGCYKCPKLDCCISANRALIGHSRNSLQVSSEITQEQTKIYAHQQVIHRILQISRRMAPSLPPA